MSNIQSLHPDGHDFDPFLYAVLGEDRDGASVTVISALARLGLDPWKAAAELAALDPKAARERLGTILEGVKDVPKLDRELGSVAANLVLKLPKRLLHRAAKTAAPLTLGRPSISIGWLLALVIVGFALARFYILAQGGVTSAWQSR